VATIVNRVTGRISSEDLGKTLMHKHFAFGFPGFQGDTLGPYDPKAIVETGIEVAEKAKSHGVETMVDATPNECGRDVEVLREISERAKIQVICSTGYYFEGEGAPAYFAFRQALGSAPVEVEELMMAEITDGIGDMGIKAGVVKLASKG
jgi:phosphotriesterase-related protein